MLTNRVILTGFLKKQIPLTVTKTAPYSTGGFFDEREAIGKREWVGYGINGQPVYQDLAEVPMPAIRFREITGDLIALREKEKSDWKNLTIEEKKKLYRTSFRQTLVESQAPTGDWKFVLAGTFAAAGLVLWIFFFLHHYVYAPLPITFSEEYKAATLRRMIDLKEGHLTGISSKWDYEKDDWKK